MITISNIKCECGGDLFSVGEPSVDFERGVIFVYVECEECDNTSGYIEASVTDTGGGVRGQGYP